MKNWNIFRRVNIKILAFVSVCVLFMFFHNKSNRKLRSTDICGGKEISSLSLSDHYNIVNNYFEKRKNWTTSNLGSILFKNIDISNFKQQNRSFTIWIHKRWKYHNLRHKNLETYKVNCSVKNCKFIPNPTEQFDAVVVNLMFGRFPTQKKRTSKQIWIFYSDESPLNKFLLLPQAKVSHFANIFNWSLTYRHDAEIPVPSGRVVPLSKPIIPNFKMSKYYSSKSAEQILKKLVPNWKKKRKDVLVTIMYSNCIKEREKAIDILSQKLEVHVYGECSKDPVLNKTCSRGYGTPCLPTQNYLFYLVIENSNCVEYITEKAFYHGFTLGAIPIMIGPSITDCQLHLPPNSFIYVQELEDLHELGEKLIKIAQDKTELLKYHEWRNYFTTKNEHGCFRTESKYMCRICEGLNYNEYAYNVYDLGKLGAAIDSEINCWE